MLSIDEADCLGYAANSLCVNGTVLMPTGLSTGLRGNLVKRGFNLEELELGELFGKGGGGPRCLVNELRGFVLTRGRARLRVAARAAARARRALSRVTRKSDVAAAKSCVGRLDVGHVAATLDGDEFGAERLGGGARGGEGDRILVAVRDEAPARRAPRSCRA